MKKATMICACAIMFASFLACNNGGEQQAIQTPVDSTAKVDSLVKVDSLKVEAKATEAVETKE
jgi:hypothetical protein